MVTDLLSYKKNKQNVNPDNLLERVLDLDCVDDDALLASIYRELLEDIESYFKTKAARQAS